MACIMGVGFSGCGHTTELLREEPVDEATNVEYSVIYYIHADADYLYHDAEGRPVRANTRVLETALEVAEEAHSGEVFIFYQRPEKKILGLFPRKSSLFYHFVNGERTSQVKYRHPDKKEDFLTTEAQLYNQYRNHVSDGNKQRYLLYFGHEIPDKNGKGYHRSLPELRVNTDSFADGIRRFLSRESQKFDLVVLSTCNNGTPAMANKLSPFTDYLLASPQNLHLSHIDSDRIGVLESNPGGSSPFRVARVMAGQTYRRLAEDIQTTITLGVYDFERIRSYINELYILTASIETSGQTKYFSDNVDCSRYSVFDHERFRQGVETWFKPARFGRKSSKSTHSGWGCKPRE